MGVNRGKQKPTQERGWLAFRQAGQGDCPSLLTFEQSP